MNPNHLNRSYDNGLDSYLKETSPKGVKATGRDVCLKKRVQLPWFLMRKSNNIFITVVPTNERNGGLLKLNRGLS